MIEVTESANEIKVVPDGVILFSKLRQDAIIPTKEESNAGYDLYGLLPEGSTYIVIEPWETGVITTGIACAVNSNYYVQVEERGSTGLTALKRSAGVMDSGYRDEWLIEIYNGNFYPIIIGTKEVGEDIERAAKYFRKPPVIFWPIEKAIAQGIVHIVPKMKPETVSYEDLSSYDSKRGTGRFGSTGK